MSDTAILDMSPHSLPLNHPSSCLSLTFLVHLPLFSILPAPFSPLFSSPHLLFLPRLTFPWSSPSLPLYLPSPTAFPPNHSYTSPLSFPSSSTLPYRAVLSFLLSLSPWSLPFISDTVPFSPHFPLILSCSLSILPCLPSHLSFPILLSLSFS